MTVIIAGICGKKVVMLGDRLNIMEEETYEQENPKIYCLNESMCVGFAGSSGYEPEFIEYVDNLSMVSELVEIMKEDYRKLRMKLVKEHILGRYGIKTIDELKGLLGNAPEVLSYHMDEIKNFDPDIKILIGGVDIDPHIFAIGNPGMSSCFDEVGFYAIGTGEKEATMMLNFLNYRKSLPLKICVFYLYLAKKAAEIAVGVGKKTDIFLISSGEVERIDEKEYLTIFKSWMKEIKNMMVKKMRGE